MPDEDFDKDDERSVVESMLKDLGVDEEMKKDLIESGSLSGDVLTVETPEEIRRRISLDKNIATLKDSINLVERNVMTIENSIDRIERDLIPVVLSFLVGLKGNLVNLRTTVVGRSKRRAKTNLQATFIENEVNAIVSEEFSTIEESLTSGMSEPILEKVRDITDGLKASTKSAYEEIATLKASVDDFTQKASTELEFLGKELTMKPKVEVPKEVNEQLKTLERRVEELTNELQLSRQKLQNRENEMIIIQENLAATRAQKDDLDQTVATLKSAPIADAAVLAELRQTVKALETAKNLLSEKLDEATEEIDRARAQSGAYKGEIAKKDIEIDDFKARILKLEDELEQSGKQTDEVDELRARIRSYESGEIAREMERASAELERVSATLERLQRDHKKQTAILNYTQERIDSYMSLMNSTDKTKAYLIVEDVKEMSLREVARSVGTSPGNMRKWADEYVKLGIAKIVGDQTLVVDRVHPDEAEKESDQES
jgi:chromosome segregation ATPase